MNSNERLLKLSAVLFALASSLHVGDHFRRGTETVNQEVIFVGNLGILISVAAVLMVLFGSPMAPQAALVAGVILTVGFIAVHWLPTWSVYSDSFVEGDSELASQLASLTEIAGGVFLIYAAMRLLRARSAPA